MDLISASIEVSKLPMSTPKDGRDWGGGVAWRGSHRVRMDGGHRGLVVHGGFIPSACSHGGTLPPTLTSPSHLSRLRLQDRIRIIPLDVTLEGSWAHLLSWGPVDLVVSNPPYVFSQDSGQMGKECVLPRYGTRERTVFKSNPSI